MYRPREKEEKGRREVGREREGGKEKGMYYSPPSRERTETLCNEIENIIVNDRRGKKIEREGKRKREGEKER